MKDQALSILFRHPANESLVADAVATSAYASASAYESARRAFKQAPSDDNVKGRVKSLEQRCDTLTKGHTDLSNKIRDLSSTVASQGTRLKRLERGKPQPGKPDIKPTKKANTAKRAPFNPVLALLGRALTERELKICKDTGTTPVMMASALAARRVGASRELAASMARELG